MIVSSAVLGSKIERLRRKYGRKSKAVTRTPRLHVFLSMIRLVLNISCICRASPSHPRSVYDSSMIILFCVETALRYRWLIVSEPWCTFRCWWQWSIPHTIVIPTSKTHLTISLPFGNTPFNSSISWCRSSFWIWTRNLALMLRNVPTSRHRKPTSTLKPRFGSWFVLISEDRAFEADSHAKSYDPFW